MSLRGSMVIAGLVVAFAATQAFAFQEQRQGGSPGAASSPAPAVDLSSPPSQDARPGSGTEVRIPGLGRLGNLPRMDFGLELLYGAAETKQPIAPAGREEPRDDDLTIRGSVRHKF